MFFPFLVDERDALMKHLADSQIPPKVYWPVPPFIEIEKYPGAQYIYDHVMSISCDQRFDRSDMERVAEVFREFAV